MRVPPRARVTFVSAKVTKTIFPHRRTPTPSVAWGGGALRSSVGEGVGRQDLLSCGQRAPPGRAPHGNSMRASSSPTSGARCDSRGGTSKPQNPFSNGNPGKSWMNLNELEILRRGARYCPGFARYFGTALNSALPLLVLCAPNVIVICPLRRRLNPLSRLLVPI
jgi:hypothetical protein